MDRWRNRVLVLLKWNDLIARIQQQGLYDKHDKLEEHICFKIVATHTCTTSQSDR